MTTADAISPLPSDGAIHFLGSERDYWRLRIKGAAFVMVTLGIYRFWLATDVRRFLWSNTEIDGETLEYNGLATELLVGFLFASLFWFRSIRRSPLRCSDWARRKEHPASSAFWCSSCLANSRSTGRGATG